MKPIKTMALLWVLLVGLLTTACPSKNTSLQDGFAASVRVSSYGTDLTRAITQLKRDNAISAEKFTQLIDLMEGIDISGRRFHNVLKGLVDRYPDGNVPSSQFKAGVQIFDTRLYAPLLEVIGIIAGLSPANQKALSVALTGLRLAVFTIKRLITKNSSYLGLPNEENIYAIA